MSITGAADADGGEPTKVGVAISDVVTGMLGAVSVLAALVGRERAGQGAAGQRIDVSLLGSTLAIARQPGPERVRRAARRRAGGQRAPEHRPVRDVRDGRRRDRGRGRLRAAVAAVLRCRSACPRSPPTRGSPRTATGSSTAASCARSWPPGSRSVRRRPGWPRSTRPRSRRADQRHRRGVRLARGDRARHDRRDGAPGLGRHPPGRRAVRAVGDARDDPDAAAAARRRTPTRSSPSSATATRRVAALGRPASSERTRPTAADQAGALLRVDLPDPVRVGEDDDQQDHDRADDRGGQHLRPDVEHDRGRPAPVPR